MKMTITCKDDDSNSDTTTTTTTNQSIPRCYFSNITALTKNDCGVIQTLKTTQCKTMSTYNLTNQRVLGIPIDHSITPMGLRLHPCIMGEILVGTGEYINTITKRFLSVGICNNLTLKRQMQLGWHNVAGVRPNEDLSIALRDRPLIAPYTDLVNSCAEQHFDTNKRYRAKQQLGTYVNNYKQININGPNELYPMLGYVTVTGHYKWCDLINIT